MRAQGRNKSFPLATEHRDVLSAPGCVSKAESTEPEMVFKKPFLPILATQLRRAQVGCVWSSSSSRNSSAKCCRDQSLPCTHRFSTSSRNPRLCSAAWQAAPKALQNSRWAGAVLGFSGSRLVLEGAIYTPNWS